MYYYYYYYYYLLPTTTTIIITITIQNFSLNKCASTTSCLRSALCTRFNVLYYVLLPQ
jgi:hypothetical protein